MKIKVVGDEFTCLGFNLAGVDTVVTMDRETVDVEFEKSLQDEEIGLIFITEKEADLIRDKVDKQKTEGKMPLVVEIPSKVGWRERGRTLQLIKRVLSIEV
ncbi:V-type ATP synthase subunit F [candidate division WOR-3 bacterium]|nr:V-type ATP synthase subunit F [candidate division WOR-3 bacterium]